MKGLKEYDLSFSGLKNGKHSFEFPINKEFFENFDTELDFENYEGIGYVDLDKHSNFMEAEILTKGKASLLCDYDTEPYEEEVENAFPLIIKFGEEYNDEDDEVLVLPEEAYQFSVAQYLYESVVLSIPLKRACSECLSNTDEYQEEDFGEEKEKETDPRWEALKKLKE